RQRPFKNASGWLRLRLRPRPWPPGRSAGTDRTTMNPSCARRPSCTARFSSPITAHLLAGEYVPEVALADEREHMETDLKTAHGLLAAKGINVIDHLVVGEPVDVLTKLVAELGIDLLILGHPRSKSFALRWWRGSVDAILIERVRCSILVAADPKR